MSAKLTPAARTSTHAARRLGPLLERERAADLAQDDRLHRPVQRASRFSRNAATPSCPSSEPRQAANASTSRSSFRASRVSCRSALIWRIACGLCFVERLDVARDPVLEVVDDELDEPPRLRGLGRDALARHDQPARATRRDQPRRALRAAAAGKQPEVHLGKAELRIARRDPEVARERDLEPAAEAVAVDRGDDRHRRALDQVGDRLDPAGPIAAAVGADEPADVGARPRTRARPCRAGRRRARPARGTRARSRACR